MVKWMSRVAANRGKSLLPSTIITLVIVAMLIISGPAQAVAVKLDGLHNTYTKGNDIDFQVIIELNDQDKFVPITNISLELIGNVSKKAVFDLNGKKISGNCNIEMEPVSIPTANDIGYGYGYDSGYGSKFGYGYGYGYGYGGGGGKINFIYDVTIETTCLPAGQYTVAAALNTDQEISFKSSPFVFTLEPVETLNAVVEIKPETLNLGSKGTFTAFITSEEFDIKKINGNTVRITCDGCNNVHAVKWNAADNKFIAKFRTEDLENVITGDVRFIITGMLKNDGGGFEGSDTIRVIDKNKGQKNVEECECDDHAKENDHDDECDNEKEHDHEDDQENNNGGQGKNVIINNNNININNNKGTININIYNQGSGTDVNQDSNNINNANGNKKGYNNKKGNNGKGKK